MHQFDGPGVAMGMHNTVKSIESFARTVGAAFCLSGAGPTLLCITRDKTLKDKLAKKLRGITRRNWEIMPLHVEFEGARVL